MKRLPIELTLIYDGDDFKDVRALMEQLVSSIAWREGAHFDLTGNENLTIHYVRAEAVSKDGIRHGAEFKIRR